MASFKDIFNHLVLPPQIPGKQDAEVDSIGDGIIARLIQATSTLSRLDSQGEISAWEAIRQYFRRCQSLQSSSGRLEKKSLISEFQHFNQGRPLLLPIVEQNAAIIIRYNSRSETEAVVFEAFELSPPSVEVLASENALIRDFPDCSAQIPLHVFRQPSFQHALADFLEKGSMEPLRCFQAFVTKAQTSVVESRDSGSPGLVTHVLIPLLESIGSPVDEGIPRLRKRVRDDANIEVTEFPWRRLPLWIAMRVGIQRQLQIPLGNEAGRAHYKFLVTALLTELLLESSGKLAPELTLTLRAKICRRLAKLKQDRIRFPVYDLLFNATASFFEQSITEVTQTVHSAWEKFKRATTRAIPRLPERADFQAQVLSLPNSGRYLRSVLELPHLDHRTSPSPLVQLPSLRGTTIEQVEQFTDMYYQLAAIEDKIEAKKEPRMNSYLNLELRCEKLADSIIRLISTVGAVYDSDPEQTSIFILSLFSLWVRLDECVAEICPMILEYHPVFDPELLDALHLPDIASMRRLRTIQSYLRNRRDKCKHRTTILSEAKKRSFTVRYVKKSDSMQKLHEKIQLRSDKSREKKTLELDKWSSEFDEHSSGISGGTCTCTFKPDGTRNVRGCTKCWHWRKRRRMEIYAHEDFLSNDPVRAAAVIFEVGIPKSIAAYRDATWKIIMLAYPGKPQSATPALLLKDYEPLTAFASKTFTNITIASTRKSFRGTHYKVSKKRMKASESDVLYPNGLNFSLFDAASNTWVKDFHKPLTFQHCCGVHMPFGLRSSVIPNELHPPTVINGSSSYEIVASEPQCPTGVSVQEFTACQRLLSGKNRRWMTMLVELGASNVNFSSQDTMDLFNHLAVQAGSSKDKHDTFGDIHAVFKDDSFCECLAAQVEKRLSDILSNWREVHCMEILITLSLRLDDLTSLKRAKSILLQARHTTLAWITRLRTDVRNAKDATIEETAARYAFWAALLCRRTFSNISKSHDTISENDLSNFVQAYYNQYKPARRVLGMLLTNGGHLTTHSMAGSEARPNTSAGS